MAEICAALNAILVKLCCCATVFCVWVCLHSVNFPSHGSGADVVDALSGGGGCRYKSAELSMHDAGGVCSPSSSSASGLLHQRQHVCDAPSAVAAAAAAAGASAGAMLPSFGFTQEQVRETSCSAANSQSFTVIIIASVNKQSGSLDVG